MKKKSIVFILLFLLMMIGLMTQAKAADLSFTYGDGEGQEMPPFYRGNETIYCSQLGGRLRTWWGEITYRRTGTWGLTPQQAFALTETDNIHIRQQIVWQTPGLSSNISEPSTEPYYQEAKNFIDQSWRYRMPNNTNIKMNDTNPQLVSSDNGQYKVGPFSIDFEKGEFYGLDKLYIKDSFGRDITVQNVIFENGYVGSVANISPNEKFYVTCNIADTLGAGKIQLVAQYKYTACSGTHSQYVSDGGNPNAGKAQRLVGIQATRKGETTDDKSPEIELTIDLAGHVFEDVKTGKKNEPNGYLDGDDKRKAGIEVTLYREDKTKVATTTTNAEGKYEFKKVSAADKYYVDFKYDGQNYEPTTYQRLNRKIEEKSYATDGKNNRKNFNAAYEKIAGEVARSRDLHAYTGPNGLESNTLYYSVSNNKTELENINYGMIEREQFDLRLTKDLYSAQLKINGKSQNYQYNGRNDEDMTVNVKQGDIFVNDTRGTESKEYERSIRKTDLDYKYGEADQTGSLEVYATYMLRIYNQSNNQIDGEVTKLIDWYDKSYTYVSSQNYKGTALNWNQVASDEANLNKMEVSRAEGLRLQAGESEYIYVTYKVNVDDLKNKADGTQNLKQNYAEIGEYKSYYHETRYNLNRPDNSQDEQYIMHRAGETAGLVDKDSTPGNFKVSNNNYEDDADKAPGLKLKVEGTRTLAGNVWEDEAIAEKLKKENIRLGNGQKDKNESVIDRVIVELVELSTDGSQKRVAATTQTNADGSYGFNGYIPGDYVVRFRYGEGETLTTAINNGKVYTGQDYKATIYDDSKHNANEYWYTDNSNNLSDATDDMNRRNEVNSYSKEITNHKAEVLNYKAAKYDGNDTMLKELEDNTKMKANTTKMNLEIEYARTQSSYGQSTAYDISKVDFGIIERPRSELTITKNVNNLKVVTSDGQTLFDANGPTTNLAWNKKTGMIQATIDENLLHGSTLQLTYNMTVTNTGEKDYNDETFYRTGVVTDESHIVKTKNMQTIDYIANNLDFNQDKNAQWEKVEKESLQPGNNANLVNGNIDISTYNVIVKTNTNNQLTSKSLAPTENLSDSIILTKVLVSENDQDSLTYDNMLEIVHTGNDVGRRSYNEKVSIPGNLNPNEPEAGLQEPDAAKAEEVIVLPPFGMNANQIIIYTVGAIALVAILGTGIYFIRKKVVK